MTYFILWTVIWGVVGSFGTAFIHEKTGRDVTMGGVIGLAVGAVGGIFLLVLLWVWLYYIAGSPVGRVYYSGRRKPWYRWWD